jgi:hypothetical protein
MAGVESVIVPLTGAIGLSVVVERVIEMGKNLAAMRVTSQSSRTVPRLDGGAGVADLEVRCENARAADDHESVLEQLAAITEQLSQAQAAREAATDVAARSTLDASIAGLQRDQADSRS